MIATRGVRPAMGLAMCLAMLAVAGPLAAGCASVLPAAGVGQRPHHTPAPSLGPAFQIGVYEPTAPHTYAQVAAFGHAVGVKPKLALYFSGWGEKFRAGFARQAFAHGATPLIQIEPWHASMEAIATGGYDHYLGQFADAVRAFRYPVVIGFAHEMNGWWYPWGWTHTSPRVWVRAWRRVVEEFRRHGAANVLWLWTINRGLSGKMGPLRAYWPGASYVSWVGIDSYYFMKGQTFRAMLGPTLRAVRSITSDPIMLAEAAIGPVAGQAATLPNLFAGIARYRLRGLVWFDADLHGSLYTQDWRLEGNQAAVAAFRRGLRLVGAGLAQIFHWLEGALTRAGLPGHTRRNAV